MSAAPSVEALSYEPSAPRTGRVEFWIGWVLSVGIAILIGMGGVMDLLKPPFVLEGLARAHFHEEIVRPLGVVILASVVLFLLPRTAIFGAVLLSAYFGGAVTVHAQLREYGLLIAPILVATLMWVALMLRDPRFRALLRA